MSPCSLRPRRDEDNISSLELDPSVGLEDSLLNRVPLEIRQEIYSYVLGRQDNFLIMVPFKIRAVLDSCTWDRNHRDHPERTDPLDIKANGQRITDQRRRFWPQRTALLCTCRQAYAEAIGLLYTQNTFVITHPQMLFRFAKSIPIQRFNSIRNLRVSFSTPSCGALSYWTFNYWRRAEWEMFWKLVASMDDLRTLRVDILDWTAENLSPHNSLLRDISHIRGLQIFRLNIRRIHRLLGAFMDGIEVQPEGTNDFIRCIEAAVVLPKKSSNLLPVQRCCYASDLQGYHPPDSKYWLIHVRSNSKSVAVIVDIMACVNYYNPGSSFSDYRYNGSRGGRTIPFDVSPEALEYNLPCPTCNQRKARRLQQLR
ncbi:MAG: hypothetical protein LQ346_008051 [Caloplaca aetnensis]|nr:MAG: hypothetical protein LQ346_008051 [Caloplaca aetnensis]